MDEVANSPRDGMKPRNPLASHRTPGKAPAGFTSPPGNTLESTRMTSPNGHLSFDEPDFSRFSSPGSPDLSAKKCWKPESSFEVEKLSKSACTVRDKHSHTSKGSKTMDLILERHLSASNEEEQPSGVTVPLKRESRKREKSGRSHSGGEESKLKEHKSTDTYSKESGSIGTMLAVFGVVAAISGSIAYVIKNQERSKENWDIQRHELREDIKEVKALFPTQSEKTFKNMLVALRSGMEVNPSHPGILVLLNSPDARETAVCLLNKLVEILVPRFNAQKSTDISRLIVNSSKVQDRDSLHRSLDESLSSMSVAGILDLQKLDGEKPLVLHGFADDSNAPYKHTALVMTLEGNISNSDCNPDRTAEELLKSYWSEIGVDKGTAVITRVTNAVVHIAPESKGTIARACPTVQ